MPALLHTETTVMTDQHYRELCDKHLDQFLAGLIVRDELAVLIALARVKRNQFYR